MYFFIYETSYGGHSEPLVVEPSLSQDSLILRTFGDGHTENHIKTMTSFRQLELTCFKCFNWQTHIFVCFPIFDWKTIGRIQPQHHTCLRALQTVGWFWNVSASWKGCVPWHSSHLLRPIFFCTSGDRWKSCSISKHHINHPLFSSSKRCWSSEISGPGARLQNHFGHRRYMEVFLARKLFSIDMINGWWKQTSGTHWRIFTCHVWFLAGKSHPDFRVVVDT